MTLPIASHLPLLLCWTGDELSRFGLMDLSERWPGYVRMVHRMSVTEPVDVSLFSTGYEPPYADYYRDVKISSAARTVMLLHHDATLTNPPDGVDRVLRSDVTFSQLAYDIELAYRKCAASTRKAPVLTHREQQIMVAISAGLSNEEIAAAHYLSINTVKSVIRHSYRKMGVRTRAQAVRWSLEHLGALAPRKSALTSRASA